VDNRLLQFLQLIDREYLSTSATYRPVDLARITTFFTLDVISSAAFGRSFGFLERNGDPFDYINQLRKMLPALMIFGVYPEAQKIARLPLVQRALPKASDAVGMGRVMG